MLRTPVGHDVPPETELALHHVVKHLLVLARVRIVDEVCIHPSQTLCYALEGVSGA